MRKLLIFVLSLIASSAAFSQNWYSRGLIQRGVPHFLAFDGTVALVATEPAFTVAIDRVDFSAGSAAALDLIDSEAVDLRSGVEFADGLAVLYRSFPTGRYFIRHYSFSGAITDLTPADNVGEASPLASDGMTLYLIAGDVLLSRTGLGGSWVSGPAAPFTPMHDRSRGLVVGDRVIFPSPTALLVWSANSGFQLLSPPPNMQVQEMGLEALGETIYVVLADRSSSPFQAVMWELPPASGTPLLHPSTLFFEHFFSNHAFRGHLYIGGIYGSDFRSRLLEFDPVLGTWSIFSPQGPWANPAFGQVCDIASAGDTLVVAWESVSFGNLARLIATCSDHDGDMFGAPGDPSCPGGADTDCDDANVDVFPGRPENCDGVDNDCNGQVDEGAPGRIFFADADGDGFGNPLVTVEACFLPPGYVFNNRDCDDGNISIHPGAPELCDGRDNDCNGIVDDAALITIHADQRVAGGNGQPSTKEPLPDLLVGIYDASAASCARTGCGGVSWKHFTCVASNCVPILARRRTNIAGDVTFRLPPGGEYLVIGDDRTEPNQSIDKDLGSAVSDLVCGEVLLKRLQRF